MIPKVANIGSGKKYNPSFLNIDISPYVKTDVVADISRLDFGVAYASERFGVVVFEEEQFDCIHAHDVLEHIPDLVSAMTVCKRLLKYGGEMHITVPYDLSLGAWQDPTHVRAFNENSWKYYDEWNWYLGWKDRLQLKKMSFRLAEGVTADVGIEILLRQPRAVDAMIVELVRVARLAD
jgi:SAM-dependent methyltransferase